MFAKLHHRHQYQHQPQHQPQQLTLDSQFSEQEEDSSGGTGVRSFSIAKKFKQDPDSSEFAAAGGSGGGDDGTVEVVKRPRGRPPGSKNRPKPPLIITRDTECAMRPLFLELPGGIDIIEAIARFTHRRNIGLTVLTASGSVANVSFRQPPHDNTTTITTSTATTVTFRGQFEILSISAIFLPPSLPITTSPTTSSQSPAILPSSFMISLVGSQGQIIGGSVAGSLITAGKVFIVAASFDNPAYHRLPIVEDDVPPNSTSEDNNDQQLVESCGMSMYHHVPHPPHPPSDLIWNPTPRPPQPF